MVIVSGGNGFLGSHLLFFLTQQYDSIIAIKRTHSSLDLVHKIFKIRSNNPDGDFSRIKWVDGDLLDHEFLEKTIEEGTEFYHCAAKVGFQKKEQEALIINNALVTESIVNACLTKKAKKLCHVSSISVLGRMKDGEAATEADYFSFQQNPSFYGVSKFMAEQHVWRGQAEGLSTVIVNPSVILGVGDWSKGSAKLITTVYKGLKFYTKGINGYIDIRDVAKIMILLMKSDIENERFILNGDNISYKKLFHTIAKHLKVNPPPFLASSLLSSIAWRLVKAYSFLLRKEAFITKETARTANKDYFYSADKIKNALGYEFISTEKCIQDSCKHFLNEHQKL